MIDVRPFASARRREPRLAQRQAPLFVRELRDPARMGWGALRVWNDDEIAAGTGFPPHPHADMEIITYVRDGAITHEDSLGNKGRTEAGDVQVMSAGTGIRHAEYNAEKRDHAHLPDLDHSRRARRRAVVGRTSISERRSLRAASSRSPADATATATRCRSAPTPACSARREGRRDRRIRARRGSPRVSRARRRLDRSQRRQRRCA